MKLKKKEYTTKAEKQKDFVIGVGIFVGLNVLLYVLSTAVTTISTLFMMAATKYNIPIQDETNGFFIIGTGMMCILPFLANFGALIFFALTRTWIALGMLGAFGGLSLLAVAGSAICFAISGSQP